MNHAAFQCDKAIITLISLSAGRYPVLRFATIPKRLLITGKPQFGQGKLSIFVPHLGQVMVTASVHINLLSYLLNDLFLVLLCKVAELIAPDAFVYHDRLDKTILHQRR